MTRRRISNRTPRELSAAERKVVSDVVLERDSDFRVKTGSVSNPLLYTPEPGVFVLSEADGRMYYATQNGWYQQGADTSPIILYVEYTDTQFNFKFKAPLTSTLDIYDGDGTMTQVAGQDDTEVTHTTNYATPGTYYFYVEGDYVDITYLGIPALQTFVSGEIKAQLLPNLILIQTATTGLYGTVDNWAVGKVNYESISIGNSNYVGDITKLNTSTDLELLSFINMRGVYGSLSNFAPWINMREIYGYSTGLTGDISTLSPLVSLEKVFCFDNNVTFDNVALFNMPSLTTIILRDNDLETEMVDNALNSFVNLTGCTINLAGNNASRSAASDAAFAIVDANNTLTVNE